MSANPIDQDIVDHSVLVEKLHQERIRKKPLLELLLNVLIEGRSRWEECKRNPSKYASDYWRWYLYGWATYRLRQWRWKHIDPTWYSRTILCSKEMREKNEMARLKHFRPDLFRRDDEGAS